MGKKVKETPLSTWLKGLAAAAIGGALGGVAGAADKGVTNPKDLASPVITGAILTTAAYLKSSPLTPTK